MSTWGKPPPKTPPILCEADLTGIIDFQCFLLRICNTSSFSIVSCSVCYWSIVTPATDAPRTSQLDDVGAVSYCILEAVERWYQFVGGNMCVSDQISQFRRVAGVRIVGRRPPLDTPSTSLVACPSARVLLRPRSGHSPELFLRNSTEFYRHTAN